MKRKYEAPLRAVLLPELRVLIESSLWHQSMTDIRAFLSYYSCCQFNYRRLFATPSNQLASAAKDKRDYIQNNEMTRPQAGCAETYCCWAKWHQYWALNHLRSLLIPPIPAVARKLASFALDGTGKDPMDVGLVFYDLAKLGEAINLSIPGRRKYGLNLLKITREWVMRHLGWKLFLVDPQTDLRIKFPWSLDREYPVNLHLGITLSSDGS